jgi:hypothetical protein
MLLGFFNLFLLSLKSIGQVPWFGDDDNWPDVSLLSYGRLQYVPHVEQNWLR